MAKKVHMLDRRWTSYNWEDDAESMTDCGLLCYGLQITTRKSDVTCHNCLSRVRGVIVYV